MKTPATVKSLEDKECLVGSDIKVVFKKQVWNDLWGWCRAGKSEVSGMGEVEQKDDKTFYVHKAWLPKQKGSDGFTEITPEGRAWLIRETLARKTGRGLHLWWHTHYNFDPFWSVTDIENIQTILGTKGMDWLVSIVLSQKDTYTCRIDTNKPFRIGFDRALVNTDKTRASFNKTRYAKEVKENVETYAYTPGPAGGNWEQEFFTSRKAKPDTQVASWYTGESIRDGEPLRGRIWPGDTVTKKDKPIKKRDDGSFEMGTKYIFYNQKLMTIAQYKEIKKQEDEYLTGGYYGRFDYGD